MHSGKFLQQLRKFKGFKYFEHTIKNCMLLSVSSEWMNYMYTLWLGSTDIPKTSRPFKKPRCQKRHIKEVRNLKFRHCIGVVAQNLKIS